MATTTNYGWTTPDDTALVKDGAAAIRTLGSSVDTTTKNLNPETTLGDIAYRSSSANVKTRLGIGSTGDVLTVAGGVPTWAAAGGAGANWSLLNSGGTALSGSTTTVSGISAKDKVMVIVKAARSTSTYSDFKIRFNTDSGSNYEQVGEGIFVRDEGSGSPSNFDPINATDTGIRVAQLGSVAGKMSGYCLVSGCNSSGVKSFNQVFATTAAGGEQMRQYLTGGVYNSSSTISSVSINTSAGTFDDGTIFIYTSA